MRRINPNLIKLAELTHNPYLKIDKAILEKKVDIKLSDAPNLDGFVYVPSIDLYVAKEITLYKKNWYEAHEELHKQGLQMLTIPEFIEFIKYLKNGDQNKGESEQILDEILTVRDFWRAEWLDANFKIINEKLHINYNHRIINGKLKPLNSEPLEDCLMKDKIIGINLDYWLKNPTKQGLPRKNTPAGKLCYWYPVKNNNSVVAFLANSNVPDLDCNRYSGNSDSSLGVRVAKTRN